ncbi:MAG TPA: helix-turn-helix domain-containing protein [Solirubrobacteraceae bacterium]
MSNTSRQPRSTPPQKHSKPQQKRAYRMAARAEAAAETRARLLSAAWQQFASRPYEDVLLREIAADAEVSAQTLHTAFGAKEQLFAAAYTWWGEQVIAGRETAPVGRVPEAIANLFDAYEAHGAAVLRMLSQEERIPAVREMTDAGRAYHRAWATKTFAPLLRGLRGAARERRLSAIVVATDLLVWKLLRRDLGHERHEAERIVIEMVESARA